MKLIGMIVNETTPKISQGDICFTTRGSDCHRGGGIVIVISKDNGCSDGKDVGRILRSGCIQRYVYNGEKK